MESEENQDILDRIEELERQMLALQMSQMIQFVAPGIREKALEEPQVFITGGTSKGELRDCEEAYRNSQR